MFAHAVVQHEALASACALTRLAPVGGRIPLIGRLHPRGLIDVAEDRPARGLARGTHAGK